MGTTKKCLRCRRIYRDEEAGSKEDNILVIIAFGRRSNECQQCAQEKEKSLQPKISAKTTMTTTETVAAKAAVKPTAETAAESADKTAAEAAAEVTTKVEAREVQYLTRRVATYPKQFQTCKNVRTIKALMIEAHRDEYHSF